MTRGRFILKFNDAHDLPKIGGVSRETSVTMAGSFLCPTKFLKTYRFAMKQ